MSVPAAESQLAQVTAELEKVEAVAHHLRSRKHDLEIYLRVAQELEAGNADSAHAKLPRVDAPRQPRTSPRDGKGDRVRAAAIDAIKQSGRAMTARELVQVLSQQGIVLGGGDPKKDTSDLSAKLAKAPELAGKRGSGWSLRSDVEVEREVQGVSDAPPTQPTSALDAILDI